MDLLSPFEKYHKLMKEEDNFNYKYNPILTYGKVNRRKLSEIYRDNMKLRKIKVISSKEKEKVNKRQKNIDRKKIGIKLINDNSLIKKESILEEKFFLEQIYKKKKLLQGNRNKIKGYFTKSQCPFCQIKFSNETDKEKETSKLLNILTDPNNNNYHNIRSCFIFKAVNFPLINIKINKYYSFKKKLYEEKEDNVKLYRMTFDKKPDMESELSKNKKIQKVKEIKREEIKVKNLYMVERPLLTTMRGKIFKNMRKRYKRPMRLIIQDKKNIPHINTSNNC